MRRPADPAARVTPPSAPTPARTARKPARPRVAPSSSTPVVHDDDDAPAAVPPPSPVAPINERIRERERAARRTFWRRAAIWAGVVLAVAGVVYALFFSPLFALAADEIEVGAEPGRVDADAARQLAGEWVGTPLPRLDAGGLREEIRQIPTVQEATVHRVWPQGLAIHLTPRTPVAAVPVEGGMQLFDAEGVDLGMVPELPAGVPVAEVPLGEETAALLADIAAVMGRIPPELMQEIATVRAESQDAIEFGLHSGAVVRWGGNTENELKAAVLATLLSEVEAALYDVSSPRSPITA
ncbi:MAG: FtsQ-type POTRA domain-containing protein [bacterium]|nr:FtsQ-type POTRA domain-containing protein [bacterium]